MNEKTLQETNKLLKVIIALLVKRGKPSEFLSLRDQINVLRNFNLAPSVIAEILGRSGNYVNKELSELKKVGKKKK